MTSSRRCAVADKLLALRQGQIGIGADLGPADAAAQLIELRQPEHVGAMHDQRVGGRDVEARFDDVGRQQQVEGALVERGHHRFELGGRHPAVRHRELDLGHDLAQPLRAPRRDRRSAARRRRSGRRGRARAGSPRASSPGRTASQRCAPPAGRPAAWRSGSSRARPTGPAAGCAGSASRSASAHGRRP